MTADDRANRGKNGDTAGGAVLQFPDSENLFETPEVHLAQKFGLTRSESRLAAAFVRTASLKMAAHTLLVTHSTARTTLKRIFTKTETNSQAALMKRILTELSK